MLNVARLTALMSFLFATQVQAVSVSANTSFSQGQWMAAAQQAADDGNYLLAAEALHMQQYCPSSSQPKGQIWDAKLSAQSANYARQALQQKPTRQEALDANLLLAAMVGEQAQTTSNVAEVLRFARDSKNLYESTAEANPNDLLAQAVLATFYGRSYNRGGIVMGITKGSAKMAVARASKLFNSAPDNTKEQRLRKGWAASYIALAYEGLNDKRLQPYFEAAMTLGEQAGDAEGRCIANLSRVHLGRPITSY